MSRRKRLRIFPENIVSNPNIDLCLTFHRAYAKLRLQLDEELGAYHGIDFDDFALLHLLAGAEYGVTSLGILATELGASRSVMLRRLRTLEKIGLVAHHGGLTDRRISLRPAGLSLINTAHDTVGSICTKPALIEDLERLNKTLLKPELVRCS